MVLVKATDVLDLYYDEIYKSSKSRILATAAEDGVEISLCDKDGSPQIVVTIEGSVVDVIHVDDTALVSTVEEFYKCYIDGFPPDDKAGDDNHEDEIEYRESELRAGAEALLAIVMETTMSKIHNSFQNVVEDVVDAVCRIVHDIGDSVYRPGYYIMEDGSEKYEEYPYDKFEVE